MNDDEVQARYEKWLTFCTDGWDWWEPQYEGFVEAMKDKGVTVPMEDIHFSGFWSQGDGASFSCRVFDEDKFLLAYPQFAVNYFWIPALLRAKEAAIRINTKPSSYVHEGCMYAELDFDSWRVDTGILLGVSEDNVEEGVGQELEKFQNEFLKAMRNEARQLYCDLESEYEYLTSVECFREWEAENVQDQVSG